MTTRPTAAVAGVEDVVEALFEQRGGLVDRTGHDGDGALVEVARDQVGERGGDGGRDLRRLEHRRVAGGERGHQGSEEQLHRVVPRGDDADGAERLRMQVARCPA